MFHFFRFQLESRPIGTRKWEDTPHTTSNWESVPTMLEEQWKLHPELEFRIVGEIENVNEDGKPVAPQ